MLQLLRLVHDEGLYEEPRSLSYRGLRRPGKSERYRHLVRDADGNLIRFSQMPLEWQARAWQAKLRDARCCYCGGLWRTSDHAPDCPHYRPVSD